MAKHAQTIRRQFANELFECVWPFCGIGAERSMQFVDCDSLQRIEKENRQC